MKYTLSKLCQKSILLFGTIGIIYPLLSRDSIAQTRPDATLGTESSIVVPAADRANTSEGELITGGARRGNNLFHSFEDLNVPDNQRLSFDNPAGVTRIFSRVTGNSSSQILGTLGVWDNLHQRIGSADLWLVNPNGIFFGPNARLDLGGSFLASTAWSIRFADGTEFSARGATPGPLLTVTIPVGLQFRTGGGEIQIASSELGVNGDRTLALIGGQITLAPEAWIRAGSEVEAGGRIELGAVGENQRIDIQNVPTGWVLGYENASVFEDIQLLRLSLVTANGGGDFGSGEIQIRGRNIGFFEGAQVNAFNFGRLAGGRIVLHASETVDLGAVDPAFRFPNTIANVTTSSGESGAIKIQARRLFLGDRASITTQTTRSSSGNSGNITLTVTESVELRERGFLTTATFGQGRAGTIRISAPALRVLGGSEISSSAAQGGRGGDLLIEATTIELSGFSPLIGKSSVIQTQSLVGATASGGNVTIASDRFQVSNGATLTVATYSGARGGNISIDTDTLAVVDGGQILSTTFQDGQAGNITVYARESIFLSGQDQTFSERLGRFGRRDILNINEISGIFANTFLNTTGGGGSIFLSAPRLTLENGAEISVSSQGTGNAGNLQSRVDFLTLLDGARLTATSQSGRGGDIRLQIANTLRLDNSEISASTVTGQGGDLAIEAGSIRLLNGGSLSVSGSPGQGGNIEVTANQLFLSRGSITAETGERGSEGANIALTVFDRLQLDKESLVSATANGLANGGNIAIVTPFLVVFPATGSNGSDILARAEKGKGGSITIDASGIFGIAENLAILGDRGNDIDASSRFGASGRVELDTVLDPNQGTVPFPETIIDPTTLIAQNACQRGAASQFTVTGKGGLPPNSLEDLGEPAIEVNLVLPAPMVNGGPIPAKEPTSVEPIVPARGWVLNARGQVVLVASDPWVGGLRRSPDVRISCPGSES
jgi:filamentous hemagglutinin family protein